jgi:hypothetical protein
MFPTKYLFAAETRESIQFLLNMKYLLSLIKRDEPYSSMMESTPETLSRLKLIGHFEKGTKLSIKTFNFQPDGWVTRIIRSFISPDNRQNTFKFVKEVVGRSFEILGSNLKSSSEADIQLCKGIIRDLQEAQLGIKNLKTTYAEDQKYGCDIDVLLQNISARLSEIKKHHEFLFEPIFEESQALKNDLLGC